MHERRILPLKSATKLLALVAALEEGGLAISLWVSLGCTYIHGLVYIGIWVLRILRKILRPQSEISQARGDKLQQYHNAHISLIDIRAFAQVTMAVRSGKYILRCFGLVKKD